MHVHTFKCEAQCVLLTMHATSEEAQFVVCVFLQEVSMTVANLEANWSPTHHRSLFHVITAAWNEFKNLTGMCLHVLNRNRHVKRLRNFREFVKNQQSPGIVLRASDLSCQCSTT